MLSYKSLEYIMNSLVKKVGLKQWRGREVKELGSVVEGYVCPVTGPKQVPSQDLVRYRVSPRNSETQH